jgi:hypothetical protein
LKRVTLFGGVPLVKVGHPKFCNIISANFVQSADKLGVKIEIGLARLRTDKLDGLDDKARGMTMLNGHGPHNVLNGPRSCIDVQARTVLYVVDDWRIVASLYVIVLREKKAWG